MKPTVESYTGALPWYEREDFDRLWELAGDHDVVPRDYDLWHARALAVIHAWLSRGRALQIVTIKPEEFLAWLAERDLPNVAATRLRYVEEKARAAGSVAGGNGLHAPAGPAANSNQKNVGP